jgi:hypothetical protein
MFATVRRYEDVDERRIAEIAKRVEQSLMPRLTQLPGFGSYCLIESGKGVVTSVSVFETSEQAEESTRLAAKWLKDENFDAALPNAPKISAGKVLAGTAVAPVLA